LIYIHCSEIDMIVGMQSTPLFPSENKKSEFMNEKTLCRDKMNLHIDFLFIFTNLPLILNTTCTQYKLTKSCRITYFVPNFQNFITLLPETLF